MRLSILLALLAIQVSTIGQNSNVLTLDTKHACERSYLGGALTNSNASLVLLDVKCLDTPARQSYFVIVDLINSSILSEFEFKNDSYLYSSKLESDSLLFLSYGRGMFPKYQVFDIKTGQLLYKVKSADTHLGTNYESGNLEIENVENGLRDAFYPIGQYTFSISSNGKILIE